MRLPVIHDREPWQRLPWPLRLPKKGQRIRVLSTKAIEPEVRIGRMLYPEAGKDRPKTRADCEHVPRPCPYVGCRYNLYLDVQDSGSIRVSMDGEPWEMAISCALDVVDTNPGGVTLEEIGVITGMTRERIRQIEARALANLADTKAELDVPAVRVNAWWWLDEMDP